MKIDSEFHGQISIDQGFKLQDQFLKLADPNYIKIIGCEHYEVLSVGRSLWNSDLKPYKDHFSEIHLTDRGGKLTLHNPGQLIIYPILNLNALNISLKEYVCLLVKTSSQCLDELGFVSQCDNNDKVGVYFNNKKMVSIGLKYQKGWVSHGLAINVSNDLSKFKMFTLCGQNEMKPNSLLNEGLNISTEAVFNVWTKAFTELVYNFKPTLRQQLANTSQLNNKYF